MNPTIRGVHTCDLSIPSRSCIPQLPPQTGKLGRWFRNFKKLNIVSHRHYGTQLVFQSSAQMVAERKRHHQTSYWFIIHPYSTSSVIVQFFMPIIWMLLYFCEPTNISFYHPSERPGSIHNSIVYYCDVFNVMYVFLQFVSGYVVRRTQEIVLSPKRIAFNYLKTFFVFDFLSCIIPINPWMDEKDFAIHLPYSKTLTMLIALRQIRCVRVPTCLRYLRHATSFVGLNESDHHFVCLIFIGLYILHWSACTIHLCPRVRYHPNIPPSSWIILANITNKPRHQAYIISLHTSTMYFFNAGIGVTQVMDNFDRIILSTISVIGMFYMIVLIAYFLEVVNRVSASENKYEELMFTLNVFGNKMKLPSALKNRLLCYYEHKFQKK